MKKEIILLREQMDKLGIDCYIIPTADAHNSEYVGEHDRVRCYLTGFTGSNGTVVVTKEDARLWTDGRYFIQCENEIKGSGITMMKMGEKDVPDIWEYIANLARGKDEFVVGFDGKDLVKKDIDKLMEAASDCNIVIKGDKDVAGEIWEQNGRPKRSCERVKLLDTHFAGKSHIEKVEEVRKEMIKNKCSQFFLSKLDDIMWLFNIRGEDVECNPVALSYAFVSLNEAFLFLQKDAVSEALKAYLASQKVILCEYDDVIDFVREYPYEGKTLICENETSYSAYSAILDGNEGNKEMIVDVANPTNLLKAVKNDTEIEWMRKYFLRDSVATTKYIYWLKEKAKEIKEGKGTLNEYEAAMKCDEIRLATEGCCGISFSTIAAYGPNAAMMHYEATEEDYAECKSQGMLLTDCGGQYPGATTDVTRTVAMGEVTDEERRDFTLVLKGWLRLMNAQWLSGCTGRNLDILARGPVWEAGMDYKCGTGHGVGCYLNVHEGPQSIRWKFLQGTNEAVLMPGMTLTDEPGVYKENKYGIRTENTLLVEKRFENSDGLFLGFENLTWVPIDLDLVDMELLEKSELEMLKKYQNSTCDKIMEYLNDEEKEWLEKSSRM